MNRTSSIALLMIIAFILIIISGCRKEEIPSLTTGEVTNILATSATCGGTITNEGSGTIVVRGICWSRGITPTITDNKTTDSGGTATFVSNMSNLDGAATYYVRAYAKNSAGIGYGVAKSFTTLGSVPLVTLSSATNITTTTVSLNGSVNANYLSTTVIFEYGTTISYGLSIPFAGNALGGNLNSSVTADVSELAPGTTYHFRIKAENSLGITCSEDMTFETLGKAPSAITQSACCFSTTGANLNGTVNANYLLTTVTFEFGTTTAYGNQIAAVQSPLNGNISTNVSASISGLISGETYHFRIIAVNSKGTVNGSDMTFTTCPLQLPPPTSGIHEARLKRIVWNWNSASGATGYKWNTVNDYAGAIDLGGSLSFTETHLEYFTPYTRYIWAYNNCGISDVTIINQSTLPLLMTFCPSETVYDDRDGKMYHTVLIGSQCWLKENMNIGTRINGNMDQTDNHIYEKYCYDDDESNCDIYGGLYQWDETILYQLGDASICPFGWRVPEETDWIDLIDYVGDEFESGIKLRSAGSIEEGTGLWNFPNYSTNETGFTALPGGILSSITKQFVYLGMQGNFWSNNPGSYGAFAWVVQNDGPFIGPTGYFKTVGLSVRCLL